MILYTLIALQPRGLVIERQLHNGFGVLREPSLHGLTLLSRQFLLSISQKPKFIVTVIYRYHNPLFSIVYALPP